MSTRLRYSQPEVIDHLASHYVLGLQTETVRQATYKLSLNNPELAKAMLKWQKHFNYLDEATAEAIPPTRVWHQVQERLFPNLNLKQKPWYHFPFAWASLALSSALTFVLTLALMQPNSSDTAVKSIGYLAVMSSNSSDTSLAQNQGPHIDLVLTAYKGQKAGQSTLQIQWNSAQKQRDISQWELLSIAKTDGAITQLGSLENMLNRHLSKIEWTAIKNSVSLQIKKGNQIIFEGPCLQLSDWLETQNS